MRGRIITSRHEIFELPELLEWNILRTGGVPCDSFEVLCLYSAEMAEPLHLAESFLALAGDALLLHGVVDEYVITQSAEQGRIVRICGRGTACRLLDNESRPLTYQAATLEEILRNHVTPYGVQCFRKAAVRSDGVYTVAAGSSQWKAVENFCRAYGGFSPRFNRRGELIAEPEETDGERIIISDSTELRKLSKRENHYGVLSEVLVIDKTRGVSHTVKNEDYLRRGGQRRRVLYTPGQSTWAAMRYTGEYQIRESRKNEVELELELVGTLDAEPGSTVELHRSDCGLQGIYRLAEAEQRGSASEGAVTVLRLKERV